MQAASSLMAYIKYVYIFFFIFLLKYSYGGSKIFEKVFYNNNFSVNLKSDTFYNIYIYNMQYYRC